MLKLSWPEFKKQLKYFRLKGHGLQKAFLPNVSPASTSGPLNASVQQFTLDLKVPHALFL